jgi:periplasmic divalent cation tolerance protein
MTGKDEFCVVLTTTSSQEEADRLANGLVSERLAACVQVLPIISHYFWQGEICRESECLLLLKTNRRVFDQIEAFIRKEHRYEVPELVQIPIEKGWDAYLTWIRENTQ